MIETDASIAGRGLRRVDMGLSGTVAGFAVREGPRAGYFTDAPELVFAQAGNPGPVLRGVGRYEAVKGTAVIVLYPRAAEDWNGKMFLTAHGGSRSLARGNLRPWDRNLDPADPLKDVSLYERSMLEKGYAVAKTWRSTDAREGEILVTLEDGSELTRNLTEVAETLLDLARVAENLLQARLGRKPDFTYWYGRSAGARPGRLVNYQPGRNRDADGRPIIDGILSDDSGAGLWLPVVYENGQDVLFSRAEDRARFVKQIDIHHLLYVNETNDAPPAWVSRNYLENKRRNALILREKGLGTKHRAYEVHGVSHLGGEDNEVSPRGEVEIRPLVKLMDAMIDLLDAWVTKGEEPPPSMSDWAAIGDEDADGVVEHPAIALPEVACPMGLYYQYPAGGGNDGVTVTGFAHFDGQGLEPLDGRGVFVDMNLNRYRDARETVEQAWRRLGLLGPGEPFSNERYAACVVEVVDRLLTACLLTETVAQVYRSEASQLPAPAR